ncbi:MULTISPECIES: helix-turn-helix domain-containing protein [Enterococcus]|uniref:helix-turn-helix domain-containing protein n=1 Tax=Enterococcus TaxID=1350 RepID=UPI000BBD279C|nr:MULTISPECIES: helix-turn-helix transcriptional regulator [Enterococcus]ATF71625.1 transcriptional regulator [Enterococcus sp. FDAARGOS_375]MCB7449064.1 helix-turn-helix domain-containing protein [Enterococcus gallinarum]
MIYEVIKEIADQKGISIYRIEKDCGMSNGIIAKWGKTAQQSPKVNNLIKVAEYLETPLETFLEKKKKEESEEDDKSSIS